MPDEPILREKARDAIRSSRLPTRAPDRTFGGVGTGEICAVCGGVLTAQQMELEIEFNRHGAGSDIEHYFLHPRCFAAWEFERTKVGSTA